MVKGSKLTRPLRNSDIAPARLSGLAASTRTPLSSVIINSGPPHRVETTGLPHAMASPTTTPNVSCKLESTNTSERFIQKLAKVCYSQIRRQLLQLRTLRPISPQH